MRVRLPRVATTYLWLNFAGDIFNDERKPRNNGLVVTRHHVLGAAGVETGCGYVSYHRVDDWSSWRASTRSQATVRIDYETTVGETLHALALLVLSYLMTSPCLRTYPTLSVCSRLPPAPSRSVTRDT